MRRVSIEVDVEDVLNQIKVEDAIDYYSSEETLAAIPLKTIIAEISVPDLLRGLADKLELMAMEKKSKDVYPNF